jgi:HEAT repeat protein
VTREQELVQRFRRGDGVREAMFGLAGGWTATELKGLRLSDPAFDALVEGLGDPHPKVRWWCIQLLDHVADVRAIAAIIPLLDDPVPRVRRNAAHALGCGACKPEWSGTLDATTVHTLERLATSDENARVRRDASITLNATLGRCASAS